jgi:hypothetical protein
MPLADHGEAETGWRSAWPLREPLIDLPDDVQVFDPAPSQALFRRRMNRVLANYRGSFQVSDSAQVEHPGE